MAMQLNADRSLPALAHGMELEWVASPEAGVERRMLERAGGEVAVASTIVRYRPGSSFPSHSHALGEEFFVLSGVFSDQSGDYPEGAYVRNPPQSAHAPFSREGCVIFVKLRQMQKDESEAIRVLPHERAWREITAGHRSATLYTNKRIRVSLEEVCSAGSLRIESARGGVEIFVVGGSIELPRMSTRLQKWSWLRTLDERIEVHADGGDALLWVKRGHLP